MLMFKIPDKNFLIAIAFIVVAFIGIGLYLTTQKIWPAVPTTQPSPPAAIGEVDTSTPDPAVAEGDFARWPTYRTAPNPYHFSFYQLTLNTKY